MVSGINIVIAIRTTLKIIIDQLKLPIIPIIVYTNLYSLYKYLVKLSYKLYSVWNRMNNLIVNVALKPLYIHEEGRGNKI